MRPDTTAPMHLTYCLNVHAGETWQENMRAIETHVLAVRQRVAPDQPFGLGLRLSAAAAQTLSAPHVLAAFQALLRHHNLYVFTINGFPYGEFHGAPVKTSVYRPDWREPERLAYTNQLADILAALLPEGVAGSISTVPVSYAPWMTSEADVALATENLRAAGRHLVALQARTGRTVRLALEPEPDCYLEDTEGAIRFFNEVLLAGEGAGLRDYLGICLDTCHLAIQFEDPAVSLQRLSAAGIVIPKVQVSAALRGPLTASTRARLAPYAESVYLHQVKTRTEAGLRSYADLPEFLEANQSGAGEARIHFHVPLYFEGDAALGSTHAGLTAAFFTLARSQGIEQFEIETYTFDVLPQELRERGVVDSIVAEYAWLLPKLG
jgi:sugar phosphate isomerase/epimerase